MTASSSIPYLVWFGILLWSTSTTVPVQSCELVLHVNGSSSLFEIAGIADSSLISNVSLEPSFANQQVGMLGSFSFSLPGACPATNRQLQRALDSQSFTLVSNDLELYPANITLQAGVLADLYFLDFAFIFRTRNLEALENTVSGQTVLRVVNGSVSYVVAASLGLDVDPGSASMVGEESRQLQEAQLFIEDSKIHLEIPSVIFQFSTEFETGVELVPNITANLNLTGSLFAEAYVECSDVECGDHGRCVPLDSGENVCECQCGWMGETCDIPSGFCAEYGEVQSTLALQSPEQNEESNTTVNEDSNLERQCQELFTSRVCPDERMEYNIANQDCVCVDGWDGLNCDLCGSNAACSAHHNEEAPCVIGGFYETYSGLKVYECDMTPTGLNVLVGDSIKFLCNTTGPRFYDSAFQKQLQTDSSISVVNNTPFCEVNFNLQDSIPVNCTAWGCAFLSGSSRVECSTVECDCEDCGQISDVIDNINSVQLECDQSEECELEFGGLSFAIEAPCKIRECLLPSNPDFSSILKTDDGFEVNWDIFTISLPLVFLTILCLLFGIPAWRLSRKISGDLTIVKSPGSQKKQFNEIREICFQDVSCSIPFHSNSISFMNKFFTNKKLKQPIVSPWALHGLNQELQTKLEEKSGFKSVLHGVSGVFQQGDLVGIMGPSGGGKTTFLSIICSVSVDNFQQRKVHGDILVNGRKPGRWMKRLVAFVPQDDKLLNTLTVRECLFYSAILRKPGRSMRSIHEKINDVIFELGLQAVEDSTVGGGRNQRGISGGERRRVTIGMELVTDPSLVILDEPTSGLDSFTALNLVSNLKSICHKGRNVILSVHQPAPAMLELLDQILLLSRGFQVYLGPPSNAADFFKLHGFNCPDNLHIAEYMLETVSNPETLVPLLNSLKSQQDSPELIVQADIKPNTSMEAEKDLRRPVRQNPLVVIKVLMWRGFVDIVRNPALLLAHVSIALLIGLFCGFIFLDAQLDIEGAQNRLGAAFFVLAFLGFWSLTIIDLLHVERSIVLRETTAGYYNAFLYLISKIILDAILLRIVPSILLSVPLYLLMGLQNSVEKFLIFLFAVSTFNVTVGALAMTFTLLSPSAGTASLLINTVLLVGLLFSGHLVNVPSMHKAVRWVHYLSPFHYGFQILAVNEMLGLRLRFVVPGYASVEGVGGDVFLRTVGIEHQDISLDIRSLVVFYAIALFLTFVALWFSTFHFRTSYRRLFRVLWGKNKNQT